MSKEKFSFYWCYNNELPLNIRDASTLNDFNKIYNHIFNT